jgi:hypothetical protein
MGKTDKISRWNDKVQKTTVSFLAEFGKLSEKELNWKPGPESWSIAQVMDHIMTTNESYFPIFEKISKRKYKSSRMGKIPFVPSLMGKMILRSVRPEEKRKTKTFRSWDPDQSSIPVEIVEKFSLHQQDLMVRVKSVEDFLGGNFIIHSPLSRYIVYSLDDAIEILVVHEERHLNQAREVLRLMKKEGF